MKTFLVSNDWQLPFQDHKVIEGLFFPFMHWLKPEGFLWNGDVTDCHELSEFSKNPMYRGNLDEEIEQARGYMKRVKSFRQILWRKWLGGNHEDRLRRYMWQHASRLKLNADDTFDRLFAIREHGFSYEPYGAVVKLGKLDVTHGSNVRQHSGWTAKAHFEKRGGSVLVGHSHRMGTYFRTNAKGSHIAIENGCLCLLTPGWCQDPDWQQGWSVVRVGHRGFFSVQQIPVVNREYIIYGNKEWHV